MLQHLQTMCLLQKLLVEPEAGKQSQCSITEIDLKMRFSNSNQLDIIVGQLLDVGRTQTVVHSIYHDCDISLEFNHAL